MRLPDDAFQKDFDRQMERTETAAGCFFILSIILWVVIIIAIIVGIILAWKHWG